MKQTQILFKQDHGFKFIEWFQDEKVNGMYLFSRTKLIVHCGTKLYRGSLDGETKEVLFNSMANNESNMFMFGDNLYITDGLNYLKYDGTTVTSVLSNAYVPTTSISRSPSGRRGNIRRC